MSGIDGKVEGLEPAALWIRRVPGQATLELQKAITRITLQLMKQSVSQKLSGQALKRRTGTLARSVTQSPRTYTAGSQIIGTVGTADITGAGGRRPVKYGAMHEFGFSGTVTVRAHLRMIKQAWGRQLTEPRQVSVAAHAMKMNLPARSFLRTALEDLEAAGVPEAEISKALEAALRT